MQVVTKGRPWTSIDFAKLDNLAREKCSLPEMIKIMGRTENSLLSKLRQRGWHKNGEVFSRQGLTYTPSRKTYNEEPPKLTKRDIINGNSEPAFGKVHPIIFAKSVLHDRLIIDKNQCAFLDGKHISGGLKLSIIMQATNHVLKAQGKPQIDYSKMWLV